MSVTRDAILDAAELRIRRQGYHAVSFRDLANDVGIKSSSVHYHFAEKEDLGVAVVQRYAARFMETLEAGWGSQAQDKGQSRIAGIKQAYRAALREHESVCLCGVLGAEAAGLPAGVVAAVRTFFDEQMAWLAASLPTDESQAQRRARAGVIVASLQGAMMMANATSDTELFDEIVNHLPFA